MKHILLICAVVMGQSVLAADKKPSTKEESAKVIEAAIRKAAKKPTGELTKADYEKVTLMDLDYFRFRRRIQLTDVKGLEKLTQLRTLGLRKNKLTDVKGLEKLTQLKLLGLGYNKLTDVKGLEKLDQLETLDLWGNQLTDVKGLEKLTKLRNLNLRDNPALTKAQINQLQKALPKCNIYHRLANLPLTKEESAKVIEAAIRKKLKKPTGELTKADYEKVTSLSRLNTQPRLSLTSVKGLEKLTQLTSLSLIGNQLTDVKGLEKLTQLTKLTLGSNKLTDVKGLEKLTQLKGLLLSNNQLTEVTGLEKLTQLKGLSLAYNKLTEVPKGLEKLTQLKGLILTNNPDLTKAQIAELQKALPKCNISSNPTK